VKGLGFIFQQSFFYKEFNQHLLVGKFNIKPNTIP